MRTYGTWTILKNGKWSREEFFVVGPTRRITTERSLEGTLMWVEPVTESLMLIQGEWGISSSGQSEALLLVCVPELRDYEWWAFVGKEQGVSAGCGSVTVYRLVSCSCSYKVRINESDVADSDRICGIRVKFNGDDNSLFSAVGVYLPCINQGVDCYREHLLELEHLVSE